MNRRAKGFSLAEAMMAVVILSIAAAAVLTPFVAGARVRAEGNSLTLGAILASELMEQIAATPFDQIVASYDGYSEAQGQVKDAAGAVFTDEVYSQYSREGSCQYVYTAQESGNDEPVFMQATVRVSIRGREIASVTRLISK